MEACTVVHTALWDLAPIFCIPATLAFMRVHAPRCHRAFAWAVPLPQMFSSFVFFGDGVLSF